MRTLKVPINKTTDHYDEELGPPIPRSHWLWKVWGCHEHGKGCFVSTNPVTNVTTHEDPWLFKIEHSTYCVGAEAGCRYFIHWLCGELEEPGRGYSTGDKWD